MHMEKKCLLFLINQTFVEILYANLNRSKYWNWTAIMYNVTQNTFKRKLNKILKSFKAAIAYYPNFK